jgi:S-DNA-T family DNA segregation ATPase FtsK/SpoIIIE
MIDKMTSELAGSSDDVKPNIVQKYEIKQEALQTSSQTPPLSFLSETSVDNFLSCKIEAKEYADIITNFLRKFDSIVHFQKTIVTPLYCEISYDIEKQTIINDIFANQNKVLEELNIKTFNLLYKNNTVRFEILNKTPSKVSLKSALTMLGDIKPNRYIIGIDENSNTVAIDINDKPNTVLIGTKGSGVSMLLTVMIVSLAYTNNPKNLGIMVLSPNNDKSLKILSQLPHFIEPIKYEQLDVSKSLMDLRVEIAKRETLLSKSKSRTIEEHNRRSPSEIDHLKRIVVIILNFNIISRISVENHELLTDLLKKGADVGISTILKTNSVDQQLLDKGIYKNLDAKLVMKLEFEQESIQLLDSRRGVELFGNGDGYYFDTKEKKNIRFQSCYMNIKELEQTIKIIETFYSIKSKII